jgi:hypothetical protein
MYRPGFFSSVSALRPLAGHSRHPIVRSVAPQGRISRSAHQQTAFVAEKPAELADEIGSRFHRWVPGLAVPINVTVPERNVEPLVVLEPHEESGAECRVRRPAGLNCGLVGFYQAGLPLQWQPEPEELDATHRAQDEGPRWLVGMSKSMFTSVSRGIGVKHHPDM